MKVKSVYEFTRKLQGWFALTFVCLAFFSCAIILAMAFLLPKSQFLEMERSALTASVMAPLLISFIAFVLLFSSLNDANRNFEHAVERKKDTAKWLQKRLEEIDNLLNKADWAKNAKISSITIGSFKLEIEVEPQNIGIGIDKIKELLAAEKNEIMLDIKNNKNTFPKKPKTYAFLEKRLRLTPVIS